jgi:hypothetical protein
MEHYRNGNEKYFLVFIFISLIFLKGYSMPFYPTKETAIADGLISYWPFDEEHGTQIYDTIGDNNGFVFSDFGLITIYDGLFGKSRGLKEIDLPGVPGSYYYELQINGLNTPETPTILNDWTLVTRLKMSTLTYDWSFFELYSNVDWGDWVFGAYYYEWNSEIVFYINVDGHSIEDPNPLILDEWFTLSLSFNAANEELSVYKNETLLGVVPFTAELSTRPTIYNYVYQNDVRYDDFGLWNRELSAVEIESIVNQSILPFTGDTSNPLELKWAYEGIVPFQDTDGSWEGPGYDGDSNGDVYIAPWRRISGTEPLSRYLFSQDRGVTWEIKTVDLGNGAKYFWNIRFIKNGNLWYTRVHNSGTGSPQGTVFYSTNNGQSFSIFSNTSHGLPNISNSTMHQIQFDGTYWYFLSRHGFLPTVLRVFRSTEFLGTYEEITANIPFTNETQFHMIVGQPGLPSFIWATNSTGTNRVFSSTNNFNTVTDITNSFASEPAITNEFIYHRDEDYFFITFNTSTDYGLIMTSEDGVNWIDRGKLIRMYYTTSIPGDLYAYELGSDIYLVSDPSAAFVYKKDSFNALENDLASGTWYDTFTIGGEELYVARWTTPNTAYRGFFLDPEPSLLTGLIRATVTDLDGNIIIRDLPVEFAPTPSYSFFETISDSIFIGDDFTYNLETSSPYPEVYLVGRKKADTTTQHRILKLEGNNVIAHESEIATLTSEAQGAAAINLLKTNNAIFLTNSLNSILRSDDDGQTFSTVALPAGAANFQSGGIAQSPVTGTIIVSDNRYRVHYSTDDGQTFTPTFTENTNHRPQRAACGANGQFLVNHLNNTSHLTVRRYGSDPSVPLTTVGVTLNDTSNTRETGYVYCGTDTWAASGLRYSTTPAIPRLALSTNNGVTFSQIAIPGISGANVTAIGYGDGKIVVVQTAVHTLSQATDIAFWTDDLGVNWTGIPLSQLRPANYTTFSGSFTINQIRYIGGYWYFVGVYSTSSVLTGLIVRSADLINFDQFVMSDYARFNDIVG